jgi:hypothetical protein
MPRVINLMDQRNLWGSSASDSGLEPQRSDLWLVDMTSVVIGLNSQNAFSTLGLPKVSQFFPQFVQSVSIPEDRIKPEAVRRDSVPYQMPSWDDPLDPLKITFVVDTSDVENGSKVLSVLKAWRTLARAGRGERSDVGTVLPLNQNFRYDFVFPLRVALLRGSLSSPESLGAENTAQMNRVMINQTDALKAQSDSTQQMFGSTLGNRLNQKLVLLAQKMPRSALQVCALEVASNWVFQNVWLGAWKLSDLSYTDSKLLTVEATLYAESFSQTESLSQFVLS